ncbi:MAG: homoserine dehydrogenase, partial [Candidatus Omnitrophota bacterium]|nr:homoserine dehydrogenase [Candidatus Omnitrophota bacterium]
MRSINLGLIGFGNVGSGVVRILQEKKSFICQNLGLQLNLRKICDKDISAKRDVTV